MEFKKYRRTQIAEMRPVSDIDIQMFEEDRVIKHYPYTKTCIISISQADLDNGSPKIGDMIARNPKNHQDQWLVAKTYFNDNFETIDE